MGDVAVSSDTPPSCYRRSDVVNHDGFRARITIVRGLRTPAADLYLRGLDWTSDLTVASVTPKS